MSVKAVCEPECNAPASQFGTYGALYSHSYVAFTLICQLFPASPLLLQITILRTAASSCYCKALQKPFTTLLLDQNFYKQTM